MQVSPEEVGALLVNWRKSGQSVSVQFSSELDNWERSGKVVDVGLGEFKISWDDGRSQSIKYSPAILIMPGDGSVHIRHSSGDTFVVFENES
jgi:hypothetical protein